MYDLKRYITDAIRTESKIEGVIVDPNLLSGALMISIASGRMLDQIKKHVFYGKDYKREELIKEFANIVSALDQLKPSIGEMIEEELIAVDPRIFHSLIGIATESTELLEALAVTFDPESNMDNVNILEEFGDLNYYQALGIDALGGNFETILDTNILKLKTRYPDKFDSDKAINRDIAAEREILNNGVTSKLTD